MIWKPLGVILVLTTLIFSLVFTYQNLPINPVELTVNYLEPESLELIEYGSVPVFAENLRFNHNLISYYIEKDCDQTRRNSMIAAFGIFSSQVKVVSFYEVNEKNGSDIKVECADEHIELEDNLYAAGEGGPSAIVNTSFFKTIKEGEIKLYKEDTCDYPIVALHELGHVFGFDHSEDPSNIMYNTSKCNQRMSDDMTELMVEMYSVEALPDIRLTNLSAVKKGRYLDFNLSVINEGLIGVKSVNLTILANNKIAQNVEIGEIEIGYGRTLKVENMKLPVTSIDKIKFYIDYNNFVKEFNENNNFLEVSVD